MQVVGDWIKENCSTVGAGPLLLTGAVADSNSRFGDQWAVVTDVWYIIIDGINRETGRGTFNGVSTITRDTIDATLISGVFDDDSPAPIYLNGSAIVGCAFSASAYNEMIPALEAGTIHIDDLDNPHETTALKTPYNSTTDPITNESTVQDALHDHALGIEERVASVSGITGGGVLSGSGTTFSVTSGTGKIVDSYTTITDTTITDVSWPAYVAIALQTGGLTVGRTSIFISDEGNVIQETGVIGGAHFRDYIFLGVVQYIEGVITEVDSAPSVAKQTATDLYDLLYSSISLNGVKVLPVTSQLQVYNAAGSMFFPGVNYNSDIKNPNAAAIAQVGDDTTPIVIQTMYRDGSLGVELTTLPKYYNTASDTLVALTTDDSTIHRLYSLGIKDGSRVFILLYGQAMYVNGDTAKNYFDVDTNNTEFPTEVSQCQFLGSICVSANSTDFDDVTSAWIVNGSTGGSGGAAGGAAATTDPDAVKWRGARVSGSTYNKNDWAIEGPWGGVVVSDSTQDRLFPQREGDAAFHGPDESLFSDHSETAQVRTGMRITNVLDILAVDSLRVYISDLSNTMQYRIVRRNNLNGDITLGPIFHGDKFKSLGWTNINVTPVLLKAGADVTIFLVLNKYSSTTDFDHPYTYAGNDKASAPTEGEIWRDENEKIRISTTEEGGSSGARYADLLSAVPGTKIKLEQDSDVTKFVEYEVITQTDNTSWFEYGTARTGLGAGGYPDADAAITLYFSIPIAISTPYVALTNHWVGDDMFSGVLQIGVNPESSTQDAYGVDLFSSNYTASSDWDITSYVGAPLAPQNEFDKLFVSGEVRIESDTPSIILKSLVGADSGISWKNGDNITIGEISKTIVDNSVRINSRSLNGITDSSDFDFEPTGNLAIDALLPLADNHLVRKDWAVTNRSEQITGNNVDTHEKSGFFYGLSGLHGSASAGDNPFPNGAGGFTLIHGTSVGDSTDYATQIAVESTSAPTEGMKFRSRATGAYSGWRGIPELGLRNTFTEPQLINAYRNTTSLNHTPNLDQDSAINYTGVGALSLEAPTYTGASGQAIRSGIISIADTITSVAFNSRWKFGDGATPPGSEAGYILWNAWDEFNILCQYIKK